MRLWLPIAAALLCAALIGAPPAHAIHYLNPQSTNIEGQGVCGGPPAAGNLLKFSAGQWCDSAAPGLAGFTRNTPAATAFAGTSSTTISTISLAAPPAGASAWRAIAGASIPTHCAVSTQGNLWVTFGAETVYCFDDLVIGTTTGENTIELECVSGSTYTAALTVTLTGIASLGSGCTTDASAGTGSGTANFYAYWVPD